MRFKINVFVLVKLKLMDPHASASKCMDRPYERHSALVLVEVEKYDKISGIVGVAFAIVCC